MTPSLPGIHLRFRSMCIPFTSDRPTFCTRGVDFPLSNCSRWVLVPSWRKSSDRQKTGRWQWEKSITLYHRVSRISDRSVGFHTIHSSKEEASSARREKPYTGESLDFLVFKDFLLRAVTTRTALDLCVWVCLCVYVAKNLKICVKRTCQWYVWCDLLN